MVEEARDAKMSSPKPNTMTELLSNWKEQKFNIKAFRDDISHLVQELNEKEISNPVS